MKVMTFKATEDIVRKRQNRMRRSVENYEKIVPVELMTSGLPKIRDKDEQRILDRFKLK